MQMGENGGCVAYMLKIKGASKVSVVKSKTENKRLIADKKPILKHSRLVRHLGYNVIHSVEQTNSPKGTCFSAVLSTTYKTATTSDVKTLPFMGSNIIFREVSYSENSPFPCPLQGKPSNSFK
jgi:hypothetical protein